VKSSEKIIPPPHTHTHKHKPLTQWQSNLWMASDAIPLHHHCTVCSQALFLAPTFPAVLARNRGLRFAAETAGCVQSRKGLDGDKLPPPYTLQKHRCSPNHLQKFLSNVRGCMLHRVYPGPPHQPHSLMHFSSLWRELQERLSSTGRYVGTSPPPRADNFLPLDRAPMSGPPPPTHTSRCSATTPNQWAPQSLHNHCTVTTRLRVTLTWIQPQVTFPPPPPTCTHAPISATKPNQCLPTTMASTVLAYSRPSPGPHTPCCLCPQLVANCGPRQKNVCHPDRSLTEATLTPLPPNMPSLQSNPLPTFTAVPHPHYGTTSWEP
jgi:hypothetical protein